MLLPSDTDAPLVLGMVKAAFAPAGGLSDDGAVGRWVGAFRRGNRCTTDVMGSVDMFAHRDEPLDEVRARFGVVPVRAGL